MSEVDLESQATSEDEGSNDEKFVPVGEAIRYRKRAQNAEKETAVLERQLKDSVTKNEQFSEQIKALKLEQKLVTSLTKAGASDVEAALLIAKSRMETGDGDVGSIIEKLKKEKHYLFTEQETATAALKTAGVKQRKGGAHSVLESSAKRAAASGNRTDVHEYMRVRRQFVK